MGLIGELISFRLNWTLDLIKLLEIRDLIEEIAKFGVNWGSKLRN